MDTLEVAAPPIKDIDKIQSFCVQLTSSVIDGRPGIEEEDIEWLNTTLRDYRRLRSLQNRSANARPISEKKRAYFENKGLGIETTSPDQVTLGIELLEALTTTFDLIEKTDPKKAREKTYQGSEYVDIATKANIEFTDFFIKVHKKFNLTDYETMSLFNTLFNKVGLNQELKVKALDSFPGGVAAAVRGYLKISSELPSWEIGVSSVELDKHHGVDLIAESPDKKEKRFYEVKGSVLLDEVEIAEITEEAQMEKTREDILLSGVDDSERARRLTSLYKLYEFVQSEKEKGADAKGFWVDSPSVF